MYANLAVITHSPAEFVMDFIQVMPGMPKAKVRSRVVMSPHHVKRLLARWLNVQRFEKQHGPIQDHGQEDPDALALHGASGSGLSQPVLGAVDDATDRARQPFGQRRRVGRFGRHFSVVRGFWRMPRQIDWASSRDGRLGESQDLARS